MSGIKHDQEKPDYSLISKELMDGLAQVRSFGAKKYQRENWRLGFKFNRSTAAAGRHIKAFEAGEDLDPESGLPHLLHAVACLEHALWDYLYHPHNDDRYKAPDKPKTVYGYPGDGSKLRDK